MAANQWEFGKVVIEVSILPVRRTMACGAIRAIFTIMFIILLMTGIAIHGRALELLVYMTLLTSRFHVFTFQFESCQVMIEFGG